MTVTIWQNMPDFEEATLFDMNNGPFIESEAVTNYDYDLTVFTIYPRPDITGGCVYPRDIAQVVDD